MEFIAANIAFVPAQTPTDIAVEHMHRNMLFDEQPGYWDVRHPDGTCAVSRQLANKTFEQSPVVEDDDIVVAISGYLTNQSELNGQLNLPRHEARSLSSTALHAWLKWGTEAPAHLYGCFSLIIWDRRKKEVFLAVDHMAQRTLYYHHSPKGLTVASLPQAVASSPGVAASINERQLARFVLPCFLRSGESFFQGVLQVEPGTGVFVSSSACRRVRYWKPETLPIHPTSDDALDQLRELTRNSVQSAFSYSSIGRVGAFLSGGLDSSVVATLASEAVREQGVSPADLICVTSKPAINTDTHDDWYHTLLLNRQLGSTLQSVNGLTCSPEVLDRLFSSTGMPPESMDYPVEVAMIQTLRAAGVSLVLCGEGGEASASSYARGLLPELITRLRFTQLAREWYGDWRSGATPGSLLWDTLYPLVPNRLLGLAGIRQCDQTFQELANSHLLNPEFLRPLWETGLADEIETAIARPRRWFPKDGRNVRANDLENIRLVPASRSGIAIGFGVELACPLLDRRLIEWVLSTPPSLRRRGGQSRRLIRDAFRSRIPDAVLDRTTKSPLFPDYPDWLIARRGELTQSVANASASNIPDIFSRDITPQANDLRGLHRLHTISVAAQFLKWSREVSQKRDATTNSVAIASTFRPAFHGAVPKDQAMPGV